MEEDIIHYGIGREYLSHWNIKDALREVFQNFIDYGEYKVVVTNSVNDDVLIKISNDYVPEGLEFLRIGWSKKPTDSAIGKYGEGLKMAALIFAREDKSFWILTKGNMYRPSFKNNGGVGECLCIEHCDAEVTEGFTVMFNCLKKDYVEFIENVITKTDVIFENHSDGRIVNKPIGNIYSGGLFVAKVDNLTRAYDIYPSNMTLDRDRKVPRNIDIEWHTSNLNRDFDKWQLKDHDKTDTMNIHTIPERLHKEIKLIKSGNTHVPAFRDVESGNDVVIKNTNLVNAAKNIPHIAKAIADNIKKIKTSRVKPHANSKTVTGALTAFIKHHALSSDAIDDLKDIIKKIKNNTYKK